MDDKKKVILVTSASSGIGEEFVKTLLQDGHIVYGGARRVEKIYLIKQAGAKVLSLEITNDDSMVDCIATVIKNEGKLKFW